LRTKCRSDHVIYTKYYDVYNHLFRNGDLLTAAAAAAHVDRNELSQHTLFVGDWCQMAAHRWQEWITVCLVAKGSRSGTPGYRLTSQVNSPLNGALNRAQLRAYLERIGHDGGCSVAKVCRDYERTHRRVQGHFSHGDQDSVFKGKWYTTLIELDLQNAFAGRPLRTSGVAQRISTALVATLDFGALWATHFTCAVEKVVDQL